MQPRSFLDQMTFAARRPLWRAALILTFVLVAGAAPAQPTSEAAAGTGGAGKADLAEIGAKLSNPVSDVWALFTEFDVYFSDGNVNKGDSQVGGRMIFQPILPFPLYGSGKEEWKLITRPTVPVLFSQPIPTGFDESTLPGKPLLARYTVIRCASNGQSEASSWVTGI